MKPPTFWQNSPDRPGWQAILLAPLAKLYALATARRVARDPLFRPDIPVICVGNLNIGGAGKTPTVIALTERLRERGLSVHVISRGFGGRLSGPVQVDPTVHDARDVGDEPLLIAAFATTWISRDRQLAARSAQTAGADVIVMDDGHQNPDIAKDLSIVVVDANRGFGNGRVIPAGPLREPVPVGLARARLVLSIGSRPEQESFSAQWGEKIPCAHAAGWLEPLETGADWRGLKAIAFAGIGHPEKFFDTLRGLGADIVRAEALDDHQPLSDTLLKRLETEAMLHNAQLVTTEKDAVRLPAAFKQKVLTLPVRLQIEDWTAIDQALEKLALNRVSAVP